METKIKTFGAVVNKNFTTALTRKMQGENQPASKQAGVPLSAYECVYIGIDPGSNDNTGIAVLQAAKIVAVKSGHHFEMMDFVRGIMSASSAPVFVALEDVHQDKTNFVASQFIKQMMNSPELKKKLPNEQQRKAYCINAACKRSRDSGMVAGLSADWKHFLDSHKVGYHCIAPSERDNAATTLSKPGKPMAAKVVDAIIAQLKAPTKLTAQQFAALTGYNGPTNEHTRDAGSLVWWYVKQQEKIKYT